MGATPAGGVKSPTRASLKQSMLRYHRWLALAAGLFLIMQGLSGSLLIFRDTVEPIIHPALVVTATDPPASPQQLVDTVNSRFPDFAISRVEFPKQADRAVIFKLQKRSGESKWLAAVDPYRNQVVRDGGIASWPIECMLLWHEELLTGSNGEMVVGVVGLALICMAVSGLITWWPRGRLVTSLRIVGGGKDPTWRTAHRTFGALAAGVLLFSATTGTLMVFKDYVRDMLALAGPVAAKPSAKVKNRPGTPLVSIDGLVGKANAAIGPSALRQLRFGDDDGRGVSVYLDATGRGIGGVTSFVAYDRYTGKELGRYVSGQLPASNAAIDFLYPLHMGAAGGPLMKAILLLAAFSLVVLGVSGPLLWLGRSRRQARNRKAKAIGPGQSRRGWDRSQAQEDQG
jgi:uncharacterized iron-regulated membrane protein